MDFVNICEHVIHYIYPTLMIPPASTEEGMCYMWLLINKASLKNMLEMT